MLSHSESPAYTEIDEKVSSTESQRSLTNEPTVQTMADQEANGHVVAAGEVPAVPDGAENEEPERPKKNQVPTEPPVTFREFNVSIRINWFYCQIRFHQTTFLSLTTTT